MRFYERAEIKDLVAYLRVISQKTDDLALERVIGVPKKGDRREHLKSNLYFSNKKKLCLEECNCKNDKRRIVQPKIKIALEKLINSLNKWREDSKKIKHYDLIKTIIDSQDILKC